LYAHATSICLAYGTSGHLSSMRSHTRSPAASWGPDLTTVTRCYLTVPTETLTSCSAYRIIWPVSFATRVATLRSLHWLSVRQRIDYKLANLCYMAISFHQPVYLAHLIRPYSQSRSLRSSTQSFLSVPSHNIGIAARRFSGAAPRLWNSLPLSCWTAPSVNILKNRLKTFLFSLR